MSIYQKDATILNVYSPNNRATENVKQKLVELKEEMDKSTNIPDTSTLLTKMDTEELSNINKEDLIDIC